MEEISEIKYRRMELGMTQEQLAKESGVSQSLIARIERGDIDPRYSKIKAVFDTLKKLREKDKEEIRAGDIMASDIIGVSRLDTVEHAAKIMKKHKISQLPVMAKDKVVGCISEKTIIDRVVVGENLHELSGKKVGEVMDPSIPIIDKKAPLSLISVLLEHSPAVIVMDEGEVKGIITKADLLKFLKK